MIDLYKLLGVARSATDAELNSAISKALRTWTMRTNHPQLEVRQDAERKIKALEEGQIVLLDRPKRADYDKKLAIADAEGTGNRARDDSTVGEDVNLIEVGWRALADGNVPDALFLATKATSTDGNNAEAWALLAQAKYRWGDVDDAIYEYKRAITLKPNQASYYFDLGSIYQNQEDWDKAIQQYSRAAQIEPNTVLYRAAVGFANIKQGKNREGIEILEKCVREEPDNESYQWCLAIGYGDSAHEHWTYVPEGNSAEIPSGYYATKKEHVTQARTSIARAEAMNHDDAELKALIQSVKADINRNIERTFQGSIIVPIVGGILWTMAGSAMAPALFIIGPALAGGYFYVSRPPRYAINHQVLFKGGFMTADASLRGEDFRVGLVRSAIWGLFLPIMVLTNYVKFHTGKNAT